VGDLFRQILSKIQEIMVKQRLASMTTSMVKLPGFKKQNTNFSGFNEFSP